jgi:hypothetical protein
MRFFFFLFSVYVVIGQGKAQHQPYIDDSFYPNLSNQYPNYFPISDSRTPNLAYDKRFLFGSLPTTSTTTTTTTTTTCTVSTAATCNTTGRKKRALEEDEENIEPSPVNE